jgi:thiosulfate/3-mercaptopyruvate sulfurtransferase
VTPAQTTGRSPIPPGAFISTAHLDQLFGTHDLRVVDTRFSLTDDSYGHRAYRRSHIPGAIYLDWIDDLSDPDDPVPGQLAPSERFCRVMERAGISDDTHVVCYDDNVIFTGARLWWCLRHYGHERVRILDGGFPRWLSEGHRLEQGLGARPEPATGSFTVRTSLARRATKHDVVALVDDSGPAVRLLDCRMDETWEQTGAHIPGARRLPAPTLVDPDAGTLLPPGEIERRARAAGASHDDPILLYCGGGVSASLAYAALEDAGYGQLMLYDGSWSEWSLDPLLPQERHDSPARSPSTSPREGEISGA